VTYTRRDAAPTRLDAVGAGNTSVPLVVIVDGGTASAAEVVTGALQDRGRAVVVGSRTFGKGTVQEPKSLSDGSSLALTVARYNLPSGRSIDGVGIEPDIEVVSNDTRVALHRAMEVLVGLQADTGGRG
jgi:carboxyl-terminal processing protease